MAEVFSRRFQLRRPGFDTTAVHEGFVVDKIFHTFSFIMRGWCNSPISGCSAEGLSVTPTQESKKRESYKAFVSCYFLTSQFNFR
jgi:hypothetical protein